MDEKPQALTQSDRHFQWYMEALIAEQQKTNELLAQLVGKTKRTKIKEELK